MRHLSPQEIFKYIGPGKVPVIAGLDLLPDSYQALF